MNKKDLNSLMEAYDSLATPTGDAAMSKELANTADVDTQTSTEGDSFEEKVTAVDHNIELFREVLKDVVKAISGGLKLEPWMEEKLTKSINDINSATNTITDIKNAISDKRFGNRS